MIDSLAKGDKTKWGFFEKMNCIPFLQTCSYEKVKYDEIKEDRKLREMKNKN